MNVRDKLNQLIAEYKDSLINVVDGAATMDQQDETVHILKAIDFYTTRLMLFGNDEIDGLFSSKLARRSTSS